jgi:uncharacterized repeat protein (TIGR02543 family)
MPFTFNGTTLTAVSFNGTNITTVIFNGTTVFSAAVTMTVTFDANGGTTPSPTSKVVTNGSTYGTLATTSRSGFTFNGWFTASSGGSQVLTTTTVTQTSNHTLFAQWTAVTTEWYFVDVYSSDPGFQEFVYEGNGSGGNISGMINELTFLYPPEDYIGLYIAYYDIDDGQFYIFEAY